MRQASKNLGALVDKGVHGCADVFHAPSPSKQTTVTRSTIDLEYFCAGLWAAIPLRCICICTCTLESLDDP